MIRTTANEIFQTCKAVNPELYPGSEYYDFCIDDNLVDAAGMLGNSFYPTREMFTVECFRRRVSDIDTLSRLLAYVHTMSHHGGLMKLLRPSEIVDLFKLCNPKCLMNEEELSVYTDLESEIIVYRGGAVLEGDSDFIANGVSWSTSWDVAKKFVTRNCNFNLHTVPAICKGRIKKQFIYAYFNERKEQEIICDPFKITDDEWNYFPVGRFMGDRLVGKPNFSNSFLNII